MYLRGRPNQGGFHGRFLLPNCKGNSKEMWNIDFSALVLGGRWKTKCLSICCSWCFRLCFRHPEIRRVTYHHCAPVIATIKNRWIFVDLQTSHVSLPEGDGKPPFSVCHSYLHFGHNWHSHYFKIDKVFCSLFTARRKIAVPRCKCSFLGSLRWLSNQGRWRRNQRWHWNLDRKIIFPLKAVLGGYSAIGSIHIIH